MLIAKLIIKFLIFSLFNISFIKITRKVTCSFNYIYHNYNFNMLDYVITI